MTMTAQRDPSLVVIQLTGGNDAMNTVVPYTNGIYQDSRKAICLTEDEVIDINGSLGFHPNLGPFKSIWDEGNMAIVNGIGYPKPNRSHFRSMDIWHTAETVEIAPNGWLGRTIREIDPEPRERHRRRELRAWPAACAALQGRAGGVGGEPGDLRADAGYNGRAHARACAGHLHAHVRAGRGS